MAAQPKRRVVVTGLGVVSCLGHEHGEFYDNLLAGKSGISLIEVWGCGGGGREGEEFCSLILVGNGNAMLSPIESRGGDNRQQVDGPFQGQGGAGLPRGDDLLSCQSLALNCFVSHITQGFDASEYSTRFAGEIKVRRMTSA